MRWRSWVGVVVSLGIVAAGNPPEPAAAPLQPARTLTAVDWVSAGVGGIGTAGTATIVVSGVGGPVTRALLYWQGIDRVALGGDGVYDDDTVSIDGGAPVAGTSLGDGDTACWGNGGSRAYVADVTAAVTGDGPYVISGLATGAGHDVNGASLLVLFDDGLPDDDRDLVILEGNDLTHPGSAVADDPGWHVTIPDLTPIAGTINLQLHVADGQSFADGPLVLTSFAGGMTLPDDETRRDGASVPDAGQGRAASALWDIHTFDVTGAFGAPGTQSVDLADAAPGEDCLALVAAIVDLPHGATGTCGDGRVSAVEQCDDGNTLDGDCCSSTCTFEPAGTVCANGGDACLQQRCNGSGVCGADAAPCLEPATSRLSLRASKRDGGRLRWSWHGAPVDPALFGDPTTTTGYALCLYGEGQGRRTLRGRAAVDPAGACGRHACWRTNRNGYRFDDGASALRGLSLSSARETELVASGRGAELVPALPLEAPLVVQLRSTDGACWSTRFDALETRGANQVTGSVD